MSTGRLSPPPFLSQAAQRYRSALSIPLATRFFIPAAVARLGVAMSGLAVLWAVHGATGSFAQAGVATAAFAVADAAVGPQIGRLVDSHGQRRVLSLTVPLFVLSLAGLVVAGAIGLPLLILAALAAAAGSTAPAVGALAAGRWRHLAGHTDAMPAALSLEAALNDVTFLVGPVLVTTISATVFPAAGLVISLTLVGAGMAVFLAQRGSEPPPRPKSSGVIMDDRLLDRRFIAFVGVHLTIGLFFGGVPVTITAFALDHDAGAMAGLISATSGIVSILTGLIYGATSDRTRPLTVMIIASAILAAGCAALSLVPNVVVMFIGYGLVGGLIAPILIPAALLQQRATPRAVYTQSLTWINSASAAGIALSAPIVGYTIQLGSWRSGFLLTGCLAALAPLTVLLAYRQLRDLQTPESNDSPE